MTIRYNLKTRNDLFNLLDQLEIPYVVEPIEFINVVYYIDRETEKDMMRVSFGQSDNDELSAIAWAVKELYYNNKLSAVHLEFTNYQIDQIEVTI